VNVFLSMIPLIFEVTEIAADTGYDPPLDTRDRLLALRAKLERVQWALQVAAGAEHRGERPNYFFRPHDRIELLKHPCRPELSDDAAAVIIAQ